MFQRMLQARAAPSCYPLLIVFIQIIKSLNLVHTKLSGPSLLNMRSPLDLITPKIVIQLMLSKYFTLMYYQYNMICRKSQTPPNAAPSSIMNPIQISISHFVYTSLVFYAKSFLYKFLLKKGSMLIRKGINSGTVSMQPLGMKAVKIMQKTCWNSSSWMTQLQYLFENQKKPLILIVPKRHANSPSHMCLRQSTCSQLGMNSTIQKSFGSNSNLSQKNRK